MFKNALWNVSGDVPFNESKFPISIKVSGSDDTMICNTPDDVPRGVDFALIGTCITILKDQAT